MQLSVARCSSFADWSEDWVGLYASINESESSKGDWKRTDCEIAQSNRTRKQERAEACGPPTTTAREIVIQEDIKWSEIERERERDCVPLKEREWVRVWRFHLNLMDNECVVQAIIANEITERFTLCPTGLSLSLSLSLAFTFKQSISFSNLLTNNLSIYLIYLQTFSLSFTYKHILSHLLTNILSFSVTYKHSFTFSHLLSNILSLTYSKIFCIFLSFAHKYSISNTFSLYLIYLQTFYLCLSVSFKIVGAKHTCWFS